MMPPAPGNLRNSNRGDSVITSGSSKTSEGIRQELESVAMDVCSKKENESFETNNSDEEEESIEKDNQNAGSSPVSSVNESLTSSTSLKENVVPSRKKAKAVRRKGFDYTPKRKRPKKKTNEGGSVRKRRHSTASSNTTITSRVSETKSARKAVKEETPDESDNDSDSGSDEDEDNTDEGVFVVERIDGKQIIEDEPFYFIKWKGWDESANTWEPTSNLDGCSELLEDYNKREAEKASNRRGTPKNRRSAEDDIISETQNNMRVRSEPQSYGILPEWPADKEPVSVEGVLTVDGELTYVVKRKARLASRQLDRSNTILVHASGFRQYFPQLVIAFYQGRVLWCEDDAQKTESEKAAVAAQMALLAMHRSGSAKMGNDIARNIGKESNLTTDAVSKKAIPPGLDQETQVIPPDEEDGPENDLYDNDFTQSNLTEKTIMTDFDRHGFPGASVVSMKDLKDFNIEDADAEDYVSTDVEPETEEAGFEESCL